MLIFKGSQCINVTYCMYDHWNRSLILKGFSNDNDIYSAFK